MADRTWNLPFDKDVKLDAASVNKSMIAALFLVIIGDRTNEMQLAQKIVNILI
ncbi:hypothetical protein ACSIGC_16320 [Tenacibaculum sp. ZS6-P6]|uniref:hypothetical protein n=1 Tax=Tenacibaculum sp. ZS6-P6 TaxID=3447503 RepID=UPI003F94DDD2